MRNQFALTLLSALLVAGSMGGECYTDIYGGSTSARFTTTLSGNAEVPPVDSNGTGTGTFELSADESSLSYNITARGLSGPVTTAHFHFSATGAAGSGGVLFEITDSIEEINGEITLEGTWPVTAEDVVNLRINYVYVNLHTEANPGGEIRGNVTPID